MSIDPELDKELYERMYAAPEVPVETGTNEWENALLSICLFGGLVVFGLGCMLFGWG